MCSTGGGDRSTRADQTATDGVGGCAEPGIMLDESVDVRRTAGNLSFRRDVVLQSICGKQKTYWV